MDLPRKKKRTPADSQHAKEVVNLRGVGVSIYDDPLM